jgi:hypothetical protein
MSGIHEVYLALALIFACFIGYMFVYNIQQNNRQKARRKGHPPLGTQAGIAAATMDKEHTHNTGIS